MSLELTSFNACAVLVIIKQAEELALLITITNEWNPCEKQWKSSHSLRTTQQNK